MISRTQKKRIFTGLLLLLCASAPSVSLGAGLSFGGYATVAEKTKEVIVGTLRDTTAHTIDGALAYDRAAEKIHNGIILSLRDVVRYTADGAEAYERFVWNVTDIALASIGDTVSLTRNGANGYAVLSEKTQRAILTALSGFGARYNGLAFRIRKSAEAGAAGVGDAVLAAAIQYGELADGAYSVLQNLSFGTADATRKGVSQMGHTAQRMLSPKYELADRMWVQRAASADGAASLIEKTRLVLRKWLGIGDEESVVIDEKGGAQIATTTIIERVIVEQTPGVTYVRSSESGVSYTDLALSIEALRADLEDDIDLAMDSPRQSDRGDSDELSIEDGPEGYLLSSTGNDIAWVATSSLGISGGGAADGSFSTTSADYWKTENNFYSTTSADYWLTLQSLGGFSTTSADYWQSVRNFFSTTSSDYWKIQNNFYSTTSADYWKSVNNFFSTTSADYLFTQRNFFSTTSANAFINASSTIASAGNAAWGDVMYWNGSRWTAIATTSLGISGGAGDTWVDAGSYVYPAESDYVEVSYINATSTTATSTFTNAEMINTVTLNGQTIEYWDEVPLDDPYKLKDWFDGVQGAGRTKGGLISANLDGTVDIDAGEGIVHVEEAGPQDNPLSCATCGQISDIEHTSWATTTSLALTDNAYNYIYYDYETGTIKATTDFYSISFTREFTLGRAYRRGNDVIVRLCGTNIWNFNRRVQLFGEEVFPIIRASGMTIAEVGTRGFSVTGGVLWAELVNRFTTDAFTTASDTFSAWRRDGGGGWTETTGQTQLSNTLYDDGDGTLGTISNNRYAVHFIYVVHDSTVHSVYGQVQNYNLTQAQAAQPPASIPGLLGAYGTLIGKVIILKNNANFTEIQSAFTTRFTGSGTIVHNDTSGLQGGAATEYYHLTSAEYTGTGTGVFVRQTNPILLGNVGVGTTSPYAKLSVHANNGETNTTLFSIASSTASATTTLFVVRNDGNVGIGTSAPSYKFDVAGFINVDQYSGFKQAGVTILYASSTNSSVLVGKDAGRLLVAAGNGNTALGYEALYTATSSSDNTAIGNGALRVSVSSGGRNTAVGATSLYLNTYGYENTAVGYQSSALNTTGLQNTSFGAFSLGQNGDGSNNVAIGSYALSDGTSPDQNVAIGSNALKAVTTGIGNIGLGYSAGWDTSVVNQRSSVDNYMAFVGYGASRDVSVDINTVLSKSVAIGYNARVATSSAIVLGGTGADAVNVGIGTTSPWRTLSVVGTVGFSSSLASESGSDNYLCIDPTTYEVTIGGADCGASSLRFKTDIQDLSYGLADVMRLRPVTYSYKEDINPDTRRRLGLIAEEVYDVIPEVVWLDADGEPESVAYDNLVSLLIKAVQELSDKVDVLLAAVVEATDGLVVRVKQLLVDEEICIGETCVNEEQLKTLLENADITPTPPAEEPPTEEPPTEEPPVEEPPVEETPAEEPPNVEEPPVEEPSAEELPAEESAPEEPPSETVVP